MKHWLCLTLVLVFGTNAVSRAGVITTTFEGLVPANSFNNNAGGGATGQFVIDGNSYNNNFSTDPTFGDVWTGWAISSTTDTVNGFPNIYSAITGGGAAGSATYAVADTFGLSADPFHPASSFINLGSGVTPISIDVTNTTYAYVSMTQGDSFAGPPFTTGDFFILDIRGWTGLNGTGTSLGDVTFNLATGASIVNTWNTVGLSSLTGAESLQFGLQSSRNDPTFGMNTPAFFAADNFVFNSGSGAAVPEPGSLVLMAPGLIAVVCFGRFRRRRTAGQIAPNLS